MMRDTAPALVMIHGLLGPIDYFGPQSFLPEFELHTPSLPGYGLEPKNWNGEAPSLRSQAAWVARYLRSRVARPAWLLGHSVGGAIAMLAAGLAPELVKGIVNVEGNFTLNDAFWCRKIAAMGDEAWAAEYRRMQADPTAWLEGAGIAVSAERLSWAQRILQHQSAATVSAMARAVVRETAADAYLASVQAVVEGGTPLHLLAGARSASGWDVPAWARKAAASSTVIPETGHMMMLEAPRLFCDALRSVVSEVQRPPAA